MKVRYQFANLDEGFVVARTSLAAAQTLHRLLERQKAMGHRVRRRRGANGETEYLVVSRAEGMIARYWLDEEVPSIRGLALKSHASGH
jgi:hypothetical protein